jgi:DNA-binding NtrC family response regulator
VRIIAATNRNPKAAVLAGSFRSDLLYRLAVFLMRVPPLRERKTDIEYLSLLFLEELNNQEKTSKTFAPDVIARLEHYHWPGNIRELKNTITRAFILADDVVDVALPDPSVRFTPLDVQRGFLKIPVGTPLIAAQKAIIMATLDFYEGDKQRTALALGISAKTLYNRLEQFRVPSAHSA